MDNRKRTRCKLCGKRVNLVYIKKDGMFQIGCPNCGGHGRVRLITKK